MDFGIGETIALSAALGAGSAAMKNQDPLRGALIGGVLGGATAGIGSAFSGAAAGEAATIGATEVANVGGQEAVKNVLGESAKNVLTEIPTETGGLFQNASGQLVNQSGQLIDQGAQEGIKQLGNNTMDRALENASNQTLQNQATNQVGKGFFDQSTKTMLGDAPLNTFTKMAAPAVATTFTPMFNTSANKYGVPPPEHYTGPLSKFTYDPNTYQPDIVKPPNPPFKPSYAGYAGYTGYAEGGITQLATGGSAPLIGTPAQNTTMDSTMGNNSMFPMSEMARSYYATPTQLPAGINSNNNPNPASPNGSMPGYGPRLNANTGQMMNNFAEGGIAGLLKGRGDGMSDSIHATIADKQPARLADGEFVVPADVVSHLGNGSTDAGAKHLYSMMDKVRKARTGRKSQGKQISAGGYLPA
jgi:hypothetical protein